MNEQLPTDVKPGDVGAEGGLVHLRSAGVSLVVDLRGAGLPRVVHWGRDLGDLDPAALQAIALVAVPPVTSNTLDEVGELSVLPEHSRGWFGTPGLAGHRDGADWSPSSSLNRLIWANCLTCGVS